MVQHRACIVSKAIQGKNYNTTIILNRKASGLYTKNTLTQWFFWLYKKTSIDSLSSHSGHRTFITNLANKGVCVRDLANLAGHKSLITTMICIETNDEIKRQSVELV